MSISRTRETSGPRWKMPKTWVGLWLLEEGERRVPKLHRTFWMAISLCQLSFTQSRIKPEDHLFIFKEITQDTHSPEHCLDGLKVESTLQPSFYYNPHPQSSPHKIQGA